MVRLPDGTFLNGEATFYGASTQKGAGIDFNSETDSEAITVAEAKTILNEETAEASSFPISTRGIIGSFSKVILNYYSTVSGGFNSGQGWHCLNSVYQSADGTGPFLRYHTWGDSCMVGTEFQAIRTIAYGELLGITLPNNSYQYYTGVNTMYTYYPDNINYAQGYQIANV